MKTKKLSWLLESPENFATLKDMVLLFDKDSKWYEYSGFVTAALLDYEDDQISILAINGSKGWITFKRSRADLIDMFSNCIEFVGQDEESSFVLEK